MYLKQPEYIRKTYRVFLVGNKLHLSKFFAACCQK